MKISLVITRISLAIALILAIATLPHHHHHGEPCWGLEEMACDASVGHSHTDIPVSTPCSDNHCYLQAMKTFLLAERVQPICPIFDLALLPDAIVLSPDYIYLQPQYSHRPILSLTAGSLYAFSQRGPPLI